MLVWFSDRSPTARICGHQGDELLTHQRLHHYLLCARQAGFHADQDPVVLAQEGDGNQRVETWFASQVLQHVEAIHPGKVHAEEEEVGRAMPGEKAQRLHRIIGTGDLMAPAPEDDLFAGL